jgi:hypothetical protein
MEAHPIWDRWTYYRQKALDPFEISDTISVAELAFFCGAFATMMLDDATKRAARGELRTFVRTIANERRAS